LAAHDGQIELNARARAYANFSWDEFTVVNAAADTGKNLFRKVEAKGVKNGETWVLKVTATGA
jgi:hypothetical protein